MKLIPKYLTAWGKLTYTGPLYSEVLSLMKSEDPLIYKRLTAERAKSKLPNSEVVIDDEGNTVTNVGAGYMSGTDPLGEMYVSGVALDPVFRVARTGILYGAGRLGNKTARAKLISRAMTPSKTVVPVVKPETSIVQKPEVTVSSPYIRINPDMTYANEAVSIYPKDLPWNFFQLIKDNKTPGLKPNANGEYSIHFKTDRNAFRPGEKLEMFDVLESQVPEGAKVSTWGTLTPGGYSGVNRFGNQYGYTRVGTRLADIPVYLKSFKSELDWSPKSWFGKAGLRTSWTPEDELILASHISEYNQIEQATKANGTWLKMKDGSIWLGDPREWVMRHSKNAEPWETESVWYTGVPKRIQANDEYIGNVWASDKSVAKEYAHRLDDPLLYYNHSDSKFMKLFKELINNNYQKLVGKGYVKSISYPKNSKQLIVEANNNSWTKIPNKAIAKLVPKNWKMPYINDATDLDWLYYNITKYKNHTRPTDNIIELSKLHNFNVTKINNVKDAVNSNKSINELIIHENVPRKSFLGNNGNLNLKDKNIYRAGIPILLGTSLVD